MTTPMSPPMSPPMNPPAAGADEEIAGPSALTATTGTDIDHVRQGADDAADAVRQVWRRWRVPLALIGVILLGGIAIAAISRLLPPPRPNSYLDPGSSSADGAHALTDILGERGYTVVTTYSASSAVAALRPALVGQQTGATISSTLVITSPYLLTHRQLTRLGRTHADLLVVEPGSGSLPALASRVRVYKPLTGPFGHLARPGCALPAARMAGTANLGGATYRAPASAIACYRSGGFPSLVRYRAAGRQITILGSGAPLMDGWLASNGNAALALNLLSAHQRIVWLTPEPPLTQPLPARPGKPVRPGPALIPWQAWLVVIQLGIAAVLVALWRARRLGPLIAERLPVVVRASETVEGHAALYQSRRARGRAAAALREDLLARMLPVLGLARDAPAEAVTSAVAARSPHDQRAIAAILYGQEPGTDAELLAMARSLDELEREVCGQ
jgi:Domain of unknown function (DUF4350)